MANLLNPMLMGPAQSMRPPVLPTAQPMAAPSPFGGVGARLRGLLAPEVALPAAKALMTSRTFGEGLGNAFGAVGEAIGEQRQQNATRAGLAKLGLSEPEIDAAMNNPAMLTHYLKQISDKTGLGQTAPSNVREWEYFNSLPKDDQARYLRMKRANPYLDVGTGFVQPDPVNPGQVAGGPIVKENYQEKFDQAQGSEEGKRAGEMPIMRSKALSSMDALDNQRSVVEDDISRAIADIQSNPNMTTGLIGGLSSAVPGSPAYLLAKKLETIKANVGFDKLQSMRENSPTGGALGQVSDFENRQLQAVFGNLEQAQTAEQLLYNLQRLQQILAESKDARRRAFARDFGGLPGTQLPQPAPQPGPASGGYRILEVE